VIFIYKFTHLAPVFPFTANFRFDKLKALKTGNDTASEEALAEEIPRKFSGPAQLLKPPTSTKPMKIRIPLASATALLATSAVALTILFALIVAPLQAADSKTVYKKAVELYNQQKYGEALPLFVAIVNANPSSPYARSYAAKCKSAIAKGTTPINNTEGQLAAITIPQVNFSDAPIGDVLDYFSARAQELTGGKVSPNFIYKGTPDQRQNTLISLTLKNVPMTEAIKYVGQLSGSRVSYEQHAIVVDPGQSSSVPTTTPDAQNADRPVSTNLFD
tara:strand:- start:1071 stop:1895 length:825 start_codon:yes stop_codon:yes gene_type:complete